MRVSVRVRALAIGVAAGSLVAVPLATPASATTPHVVCSKLVGKTTVSGNNATTKSTLSLCTPSALSAGASSTVTTPVAKSFGKVTSKLTWKNNKGTTTVIQQYAPLTAPGKCPSTAGKIKKGWLHIKLTGTTKASTGAAAKIIKAGETITGFICTNTNTKPYTSTLEPGTKFKL